ncbi:Hsp70 family protein [Nocardia aurantia]|uniref:Chaperone protein HscA n=1 Tax=Nocardia aurantia TaxID=2585199 RepID=A0A7K0DYV9_9NOCA|nr:Hsp70 family protein [Nocardia aurantia]MQY30993.1 Chaperone protein HscA [Nocardia aurantia]
MTQGLALGITVGAANTVAVTTSGAHRGATQVRTGAPAPAPELSQNLLSRVGDSTDILSENGVSVRAADLVAALIGRVIDDYAPATTVVGCPAWWSRQTMASQRTALDWAGRRDVALVPEPTAALRWLEHEYGVGTDVVVVYDLGASGVTVSAVRGGPRGGLLGVPMRGTDVGGAEFDLLIMRYVLANVLRDVELDPLDPDVERELAVLRRRCQIAKEDLSGNTATIVPVRLPGVMRDIRLVRDEVEDLYRESLLDTLGLVRTTLRRAEVAPKGLGGFLLTGGCSSIPLVAELLSTEFGLPVMSASDPARTAARGAALLAVDLLATSTESVANMVVSAAITEPIPAAPTVTVTPPAPVPPAPVVPVAATPASEPDSRPEPETPDLPPPAPRRPARRRLAMFGAALIVVAMLATGTVALGTSRQSADPVDGPVTATQPTAAPAPPTAEAADPTANVPPATAPALSRVGG